MAETVKPIYYPVRRRMAIFYRDFRNRLLYGRVAPLFAERIYVRPRDCEYYCTKWNRDYSAEVRDGDWDLELSPLEQHPKFAYCQKHWVHGLSWQASGAYDLMKKLIEKREGQVDNCLTFDDIKRRYERLDEIFSIVKRERNLKPQQLHQSGIFRESGGVYIHISRNNQPVFGCGGVHRFAMAKILKLDWIPAQLGVVHKDSLEEWIVYRNVPKTGS